MRFFYFVFICFFLSTCDITHKSSNKASQKAPQTKKIGKRQRATFRNLAHQSPIDFSEENCKVAKHQLEFNYVESHEVIENLGHTVELFYDKGSYLTFDGKQYNLVQFHFHTPSEHHINHQTFPMEIHLVHQSDDNQFLVVGILFEENKENPFLASFIPDIPEEEGKIVEKNKTIDLKDLLPKDISFYTYDGSLTTAPYTENVRWVILRERLELSKEQFAVFTKYEGFNARRTQELNDRIVEISQ